jgi:hypothetical protein
VTEVETFGGRVFLLGRSFPNRKRGEPRDQDTFVASYVADGHRAWFTTLDHPFAYLEDLAVDRSGMLGIYAAGPAGHRASLWHLDLDGRLHDVSSDQPIRSIDAVSASDGVVFVGGPSGPGRPASVRAVSPGGRTLWTATIGPERHAPKVEVRVATGDLIAARLGASVDALLATPDGVIVAGTRAFTFVGSSTGHAGWENVGPGDAYVRMYARDGRLLWQRLLGDSGRVFVSGIASDGDALYLSGWTDGAFTGHPALGRGDAFVARIPIPGEP